MSELWRQRRARQRHRLCAGNNVERIEDVAQIDQHRTRDGPETFAEVTDVELFDVGAQVGSYRRDCLSVGRGDRPAGSAEQLPPPLPEAGVPVVCRDVGVRNRAGHTARLSYRLAQPAQDVIESLSGAHTPRGRAARVQAAALTGLSENAPGSIDRSVQRVGLGDPIITVGRAALAGQAAGDVAEDPANAPSHHVYLAGGAAVTQRRPNEKIHEQADCDPETRVQKPGTQQASVVALAVGEHDQRGRRGGRRLIAKATHRTGEKPDENRGAHRNRAEAEQLPYDKGHQDAEHGRAGL